MVTSWRDVEVSNGTVFRRMNEWTHDDTEHLGNRIEAYLCECGDTSCTDPITIHRVKYERVRAYPARFVIALDHENPEIDYVVREAPGFAVVEMVGGSARIARATDPRRSHPTGVDR
ncbi:MAG TPA: hypothetical protein VF058_02445 [Actinomycetota bacterium]